MDNFDALIGLITVIVSVIAGYLLGWKHGTNRTLEDLYKKKHISEITYYKWKL